jgi:hypothetical protein
MSLEYQLKQFAGLEEVEEAYQQHPTALTGATFALGV